MSDVSDNDAAILGKQSSPKRRKTKSSVWEHFTKESLSVGCTKARCKYCNQNFAYSNGSKNAGTSHLKRHLALGACPKYQNQGKSQLLLSFSPTTTETPSSPKVRKTKSLVWEHFNVESLVGCTKAHCKHCNQIFTCGNGSKITGTSHLKRHLTFGGCSKYQHKEKTQQLIPYTPIEPNGGSTSLSTFKFDQDRSHQDLAEMIILHEYPFHMVEDSGFINFVQNLQPEFKMVTSSTIKDDCLAIYEKEKQSVKQLLATIPGRISLTSEMWTLDQSLVYMCLVGHFIDSDWKFHKRILNFKLVSYSHTVNTLNNVVDIYLSDWNIETRIFTMTTNDCSMNDIHIKNLRDRLSNKNALLLNGRLFHVRSFSHILNLLVQDGFGMIPEIIQKIRECVKYIKGSQANEEKFAEIVQELEITNEKILCLDVQTQWDTTYVMLDTALELKQAFSRFYYDGAPSVDDWHKPAEMLMAHTIGLRERSESNQLLLADPVSEVEDEEAEVSENILYKATFGELERSHLQYDTVIWVLISILLVLAWGVGIVMLLYLPIRRYILQKDICSRRLYVTPHEIVYKVTKPSFLPFLGFTEIDRLIPLHLVIDVIIEQGCLQSVYGIHTFRVENIAYGKAAPVDELQVQGVSNPGLLRKVIMTEAAKCMLEVGRICKPTIYSGDGENVPGHTRSLSEVPAIARSPASSWKVVATPRQFLSETGGMVHTDLVLHKLEEVEQSVKSLESLVGGSQA